MELRMQPRSEGHQMLRSFQIVTNPRAQLYAYTDYLGNAVYHFNVLRDHEELRIEAQAVVELAALRTLPDAADALEWGRYNAYNLSDDQFDLMEPSTFAHTTPLLRDFVDAHRLERPAGADPLTALKVLSKTIHDAFEYTAGVTDASSPIDVALKAKRGVCQDFSHIMIAIARSWGIPARYISGYLAHGRGRDRSGEDATHAWVEAYLPSLGWVGFDPTNDIAAGERHIRAAVGRDYADVPPTRGTYKGGAESELAISVAVEPTAAPVRHEDFLRVARPMSAPRPTPSMPEHLYHQQQQQQQ
jgi:transglutaminase-like putative cysteine protease